MVGIAQYILDFLKLTPRYFIALGGAAAFLLFSPEKFIRFIGVHELAQDYRPIIGIIFVLASALLAVTAGLGIVNIIKRWWRKRKFHTNMIERLNTLTEDEKQILRFYIAEQTKSNVLRLDDGVVQGLAASGIIFRASSVGNMLEGFSYNISDLAWYYLNVNHHLLLGSTNYSRTDKRLNLYN